MKATVLNVLKSSVAFSALCSSVLACGPGGGGYGGYGGGYGGYGGGYYSSNDYASAPAPVVKRSAPVVTTKKVVTARPAVKKQAPTTSLQAAKVPAIPVARLSVVPADEAPVGNLRLAPAVDEEVVEVPPAAVRPEVTKPEPPHVADDDSEVKEVEPADLDNTESKIVEESPISDALKGLLGTWRAVSRQGEGALATIELQLNDNGTAQLTTPGKDGKASTTTRKANFDNQELKLVGGDKDISLGKLVESDARQMVLDRGGRQVTFVRVN